MLGASENAVDNDRRQKRFSQTADHVDNRPWVGPRGWIASGRRKVEAGAGLF
jgi:hypothetical protein